MFMRRLPEDTGLPAKKDKLPGMKKPQLSLWPVAFIVVMIMAANIEVYFVTILVIFI